MNPEFKRNLWLEISLTRLVLMPVLIGLVLVTLAILEVGNFERKALSLSVFGFAVFTILWGCFQASRSLSEEFTEGTWDSQCMSSLTPWQMAWGKLFGSTLYAWYGGAMLLVLFGFFSLRLGTSLAKTFASCAGLISVALILHALSLSATLTASRRNFSRNWSLGLIGLLALSAIPVTRIFNPKDLSGSIDWWGWRWDELNFSVTTSALLAFWTLIHLWEVMRRELLLRSRVWLWPLFLLFWFLWSAGFVSGMNDRSIRWFIIAWALSLAAFGYLQLFFARKDRAMWLRLIALRQNRHKHPWAHLEPEWLISFLIAALLGGGVIPFLDQSVTISAYLLSLLSIYAFIARDVAWILWLNLAENSRRAGGAALVSLIVAYGLLPLLFRINPTGSQSFSFFLPPVFDTPATFAISILAFALAQAVCCAVLFRKRWRSVFYPSESRAKTPSE